MMKLPSLVEREMYGKCPHLSSGNIYDNLQSANTAYHPTGVFFLGKWAGQIRKKNAIIRYTEPLFRT